MLLVMHGRLILCNIKLNFTDKKFWLTRYLLRRTIYWESDYQQASSRLLLIEYQQLSGKMVVRSLFEVKKQLCALVPGWVTATVRVALLIDRSDTSLALENKCSIHLHEHPVLHNVYQELQVWSRLLLMKMRQMKTMCIAPSKAEDKSYNVKK